METKISKVGNSLGVILPKQIIEKLHLKKGDTLKIETDGENVKLKPANPEFEDWAEAYKAANTDYKDVLRELAK